MGAVAGRHFRYGVSSYKVQNDNEWRTQGIGMLLERWWDRLRRSVQGWPPPGGAAPRRQTRGFSEQGFAPGAVELDFEFPRAPRSLTAALRPLSQPGLQGGGAVPDSPFPSTGPHGHRQRMRDKLIARGPDALADYELLEMLLFLAFKQGDTKPLAKALINRYGSFANVIAAPAEELGRLRGVGPHAVTAIKLVQAAAIRSARAELLNRPVLGTWDQLLDYLNLVLARERIEQFRVLFLDTRNRLLADEAQARGTVNHTPVYPREVVKRALELHATALILVHNHPSRDPKRSRDDIEMTNEIRHAAATMGIVLHDHIIVGNGAFFSFRDEELLGR